MYPYISGENGYVNKLIEMGAPNTITGRILDNSEALGCVKEENHCGEDYPWIYSTAYWFGNASNDEWLYFMNATGYYDNNYEYNNDYMFGVRPVIEIPTSEIK